MKKLTTDLYRTIQAARYLGVPPWDFLGRESWIDLAIEAMRRDQEEAEARQSVRNVFNIHAQYAATKDEVT